MTRAREAVVNFLAAQGWEQKGRGPAGELWGLGDALTAVPNHLEVGSSAFNALVVALSNVERMPTQDVYADLERYLRVAEAPLPARRPRAGGYGRVELDLHLEGHTVQQHETRAYDFGRFVMRSAEAVKELVKSARGIRYHARNLLVAGGALEGSVRVILREPDRAAEESLLPEPPETTEGQALVLISAMFAAAEAAMDDWEAEALRSHLAPLHIGARQGLARLAEAQLDAGWVMHGWVRRGTEESPFVMGPAAAGTLSHVAREVLEQESTEPVLGTLDGWVWSSAECILITDDRGTIRVSVPMPLQQQVAELNAERGTLVRTILNVYRRVARGTGDSVRTQYSLGSIEPAESVPLFD